MYNIYTHTQRKPHSPSSPVPSNPGSLLMGNHYFQISWILPEIICMFTFAAQVLESKPHHLTQAIAAPSGSRHINAYCSIFYTGPNVYRSLYIIQNPLPLGVSSGSTTVLEAAMAISLCPSCRPGS